MSRKDILDNKVQLDYFSASYFKFEEDFEKYSAIGIPLTFLTDDMLVQMEASNKNFFKLNKANSLDGRDHYFYYF